MAEKHANSLANLMRHPKGVSGNPKGRPPASFDIKTLAKSKSRAAFEKIVEHMDDEDPRISLAACKEVLDRAFGRVAQADESADQRNVTINIVRYGDNPAPKQLEPETVSVRAVEVPGGWGEEGGSRLS